MLSRSTIRNICGIVLLVVVFIITGWGWLRFETALRLAEALASIPLVVPKWYLWVSGLAWGTAGTALVLMWFVSDQAFPYAVSVAVATFAPLFWIDHYLLHIPSLTANFPFVTALLAFAVAVTWVAAGLYIWLSRNRGEKYDSEAES